MDASRINATIGTIHAPVVSSLYSVEQFLISVPVIEITRIALHIFIVILKFNHTDPPIDSISFTAST